jgi:polyisoprenoid-binding protein YceI
MATTKWVLDPTHSEVHFKVKHLMISNVTGTVGTFAATSETEENDFSTAKIEFTAQMNSISTNNEQRDGHLQAPEFFHVEVYPEAKFISTNIQKKDDSNFELFGDLTIKDVTKNIKLDLEFAGITKDPYGNIKAGFSVAGKINRTDFGLVWNATLETGGVLVSEEVKIIAEIQLVKQ